MRELNNRYRYVLHLTSHCHLLLFWFISWITVYNPCTANSIISRLFQKLRKNFYDTFIYKWQKLTFSALILMYWNKRYIKNFSMKTEVGLWVWSMEWTIVLNTMGNIRYSSYSAYFYHYVYESEKILLKSPLGGIDDFLLHISFLSYMFCFRMVLPGTW